MARAAFVGVPPAGISSANTAAADVAAARKPRRDIPERSFIAGTIERDPPGVGGPPEQATPSSCLSGAVRRALQPPTSWTRTNRFMPRHWRPGVRSDLVETPRPSGRYLHHAASLRGRELPRSHRSG